MNNINPLLELSQQAKTAAALSDALFGGMMRLRPQNEYEMLDEAISLANRLEVLLDKMLPMFSDKSGNLVEAKQFSCFLTLNLTAHRADVEVGAE